MGHELTLDELWTRQVQTASYLVQSETSALYRYNSRKAMQLVNHSEEKA